MFRRSGEEFVGFSETECSEIEGPFVRATHEQYAVWLEGYLLHGGEVSRFATDDVMISDRWEKELFFAVGNFQLHNEITDSKNILVADGVAWNGERGLNTLYTFEDFGLQGQNVPVYMRPETRHLGPLLEIPFKERFSSALVIAATIEQELSRGEMSKEWWLRERNKVLAEYDKIADFFGIEVSEDEIDAWTQYADAKRLEKNAYINSPQFEKDLEGTIAALFELDKLLGIDGSTSL